MYNRYIPGSNGIYERQCIPDPIKQPQMAKQEEITVCENTEKVSPVKPAKCEPKLTNSGPDLGDLLLLCIILLLMLDSEQEDLTSILITAAAFLFLQ